MNEVARRVSEIKHLNIRNQKVRSSTNCHIIADYIGGIIHDLTNIPAYYLNRGSGKLFYGFCDELGIEEAIVAGPAIIRFASKRKYDEIHSCVALRHQKGEIHCIHKTGLGEADIVYENFYQIKKDVASLIGYQPKVFIKNIESF